MRRPSTRPFIFAMMRAAAPPARDRPRGGSA
jgi:hypothetical protein